MARRKSSLPNLRQVFIWVGIAAVRTHAPSVVPNCAMAYTRIDSIVKEAHRAIEAASVSTQTELLEVTLESGAAREFLQQRMPSVATLMPPLLLKEIEAAAGAVDEDDDDDYYDDGSAR